MDKQRNVVFDAIKALAIVLVVYAHSIQYLSGCDYWNNEVFQFIYSFHMPLFFVISGFFISSALKLSWKDFLIKKGISLLLPCLVWTIIFSCLDFQGWHKMIMTIINPLHWKLWFLKGLFLVQLIVYICVKTSTRLYVGGKSRIILCAILLSSVVYFLPFMSIPCVMVPMIWIGYIIRLKYEWFVENYYWIALASIVTFILLYQFWNTDVQEMYAGAKVKIYEVIFGKTNWMELIKMVYRILIGACGSVAIISSMHVMKNIPKWISLVGASTAAIYIIQSLIMENLMGTYMASPSFIYQLPQWVIFSVYLPIITIVVIVLCLALRKLIQKNAYVSMLLIGDTKVITATNA